MARQIGTKRIYDPAAPADGTRVLVDRIWPRGIRKDEAGSVVWLKEIAPSTALRQWFGHRPERWEGFLDRYARELDRNQGAVTRLRELLKDAQPDRFEDHLDLPTGRVVIGEEDLPEPLCPLVTRLLERARQHG